jgi:hypothetical protein
MALLMLDKSWCLLAGQMLQQAWIDSWWLGLGPISSFNGMPSTEEQQAEATLDAAAVTLVGS